MKEVEPMDLEAARKIAANTKPVSFRDTVAAARLAVWLADDVANERELRRQFEAEADRLSTRSTIAESKLEEWRDELGTDDPGEAKNRLDSAASEVLRLRRRNEELAGECDRVQALVKRWEEASGCKSADGARKLRESVLRARDLIVRLRQEIQVLREKGVHECEEVEASHPGDSEREVETFGLSGYLKVLPGYFDRSKEDQGVDDPAQRAGEHHAVARLRDMCEAEELERQAIALMFDQLGAHLAASLVRGCYHCSPDFDDSGNLDVADSAE